MFAVSDNADGAQRGKRGQKMKSPYYVGLRFLVVFAVLMTVAPLSANAQSTDSHTTSFGNHTVAWSGAWDLESVDDLDAGEMLLFMNERSISVLGVLFMPSGFDLEMMRDAALEGFQEDGTTLEVIDSGAYDNVAYELDRMSYDGVDVGLFTLVIDRAATTGDTQAIMFLAPIDVFAESMSAAQNEMTVDGQGIFKGIDPSSLQTQLGGPATGTTSTSTSSSSRSSGSSSSSGNESETGSSSSGDAYTNPVWGYTVVYGPQWSTGSDVGDFSLNSMSPVTIIGFLGMDIQGLPMSTVFDIMQPEFQNNLPAGSQMITQVVSADRVLLAASTPTGTFVQELINTPAGSTVLITMATQGNADAVVADIQNTISLDGVSLFLQLGL